MIGIEILMLPNIEVYIYTFILLKTNIQGLIILIFTYINFKSLHIKL